MSADIRELARRWFEGVWNERKAELIEQMLDEDSLCDGGDGPMRGPAEFRAKQYDPFTAAFPDVRVMVEGVLGDGEEVAVRWSAVGTHTGPGFGLTPTGRTVRFAGVSWLRTKDGKLREGWQWSDIPTVLASLRS